MKARQVNGKIDVFHQLPSDWKNYLNFREAPKEIQEREGFYDLEVPEFDPAYWELGEVYFDTKQKVFTYNLVQIPIETVEKRLKNDFETAKQATRIELLEALVDKLVEINRDKLPEPLVALYDGLVAENERVKIAIEVMSKSDHAALRKFRIAQEDVTDMINTIKAFKA